MRNKQAEKRLRQAHKRRLINMSSRSMSKTLTKRFVQSVQAKDPLVPQLHRQLVSILDRLSQKGILEKNAIARKKSKLSKLLVA